MEPDDVSLVLARHFLGAFAPDELPRIEAGRPEGHLNVIWFRSPKRDDVSVMMTVGMSAVLMKAPDPIPDRRAEICLLLPAKWGVGPGLLESGKKLDSRDWPIAAIFGAARLPLEASQAFGPGDVIVLDDDLKRESGFAALLVLPAVSLPEDACELKLDGVVFSLWTLVPIFEEELEYKERLGSAELIELFAKGGVTDVVAPNRKNQCK
ncbi:MAG: suppressor of fused domain protein [Deltaproteobacteria bacterium]|jgi:hypothetical protein|nr:suppressor of fused domain protein [Deltaproteobacteria bacterium]